MPEYQIICDYASDDDLKKGFEGMRPDRWKQDPHAGMMEIVAEFRVAFSEVWRIRIYGSNRLA